jgi:DMSO/TMAO reductase YedYZ heme-binding membrane subunit
VSRLAKPALFLLCLAPLGAMVFDALTGIVHFTWSQKKDISGPTRYGVVLAALLGARIVPKGAPRCRVGPPLVPGDAGG